MLWEYKYHRTCVLNPCSVSVKEEWEDQYENWAAKNFNYLFGFEIIENWNPTPTFSEYFDPLDKNVRNRTVTPKVLVLCKQSEKKQINDVFSNIDLPPSQGWIRFNNFILNLFDCIFNYCWDCHNIILLRCFYCGISYAAGCTYLL